MTAQFRQYVVIETIVGILASVVMSVLMALLIFGRPKIVPLAGEHGLLIDMVPQTFMIALMTIFVSTILTRRRRRAGKLNPGAPPRTHRWPRHSFVRALLGGLITLIVTIPILWFVLPIVAPPLWPLWIMLLFKAGYAALLTLLIAPRVLRLALSEAL